MKCEHENVNHYWWLELPSGEHGWLVAWPSHHIHRATCDDCGHWLSLGPAAADTPAVEIEKRAAEWRADGFTFPDRDQCCCPSCLSRFLANCIATHDQTHGGGE